MKKRQVPLIIETPLIVDNFAGGGGASVGIEQAAGKPIDIAINHDVIALEMHSVNHKTTRHLCESVWDVNIKKVTKGRAVDLAWFSPDCTHFSKARGGLPVKKNIRGLANIAIRWAVQKQPRIIMLENVSEFLTWGPVNKGKAISELAGLSFEIYIKQLKALGYRAEWNILHAHHYGAPTIRKRLFLVARCDSKEIIWPDRTHGENLLPYRTAAECIDWTIPCPSIFTRKRPLADATLNRIAKGIQKFIIDTDEPFMLSDKTAAAFIIKLRNGCIGSALDSPLHTITAGAGHHALVSACLIPIDNVGGKGVPCNSIEEPLRTITKENRWALVSTILVKYYGSSTAQSLNEPIHTITNKGRFGLVTLMIDSQTYLIQDIGLRMVQPHELFKAQGFPDNYQITQDTQGNKYTKKKQNALVGNSVSPPVARALVQANLFN